MDLAGWYLTDIILTVLGCYFVIRGCFRGFVGEVITLVGFFLSFYLSFKFSGKFGLAISALSGINPSASQLIAIVLVWFLIALAVAFVRKVMRGLISAASLGGFDRILGIFSGLLKTFILTYVVMVGGLLMAPIVEPTWMTKSDIIRYAGRQWPQVRQILVDFELLPNADALPEGTLEQILRPYRRGDSGPDGYVPGRESTLLSISVPKKA